VGRSRIIGSIARSREICTSIIRITAINGTIVVIVTVYRFNCAFTGMARSYDTGVIFFAVIIRVTTRGDITSTFFMIKRINGEMFATNFTVATINGAFITIIARNLYVLATNEGIAIIYSTGVVIIAADRGKVTSTIFTT